MSAPTPKAPALHIGQRVRTLYREGRHTHPLYDGVLVLCDRWERPGCQSGVMWRARNERGDLTDWLDAAWFEPADGGVH